MIGKGAATSKGVEHHLPDRRFPSDEWSTMSDHGHDIPAAKPIPKATADPGRAMLVGLLGGILSAAGYLVYSRLPDEQRDRVKRQVRDVVESRISEIRQSLSL